MDVAARLLAFLLPIGVFAAYARLLGGEAPRSCVLRLSIMLGMTVVVAFSVFVLLRGSEAIPLFTPAFVPVSMRQIASLALFGMIVSMTVFPHVLYAMLDLNARGVNALSYSRFVIALGWTLILATIWNATRQSAGV